MVEKNVQRRTACMRWKTKDGGKSRRQHVPGITILVPHCTSWTRSVLTILRRGEPRLVCLL